jgi:uncharacterized protein (DUF1697 family)
MRYVAFLKGINVGGHNLITKETLKAVFNAIGYRNVSTYKQSGNIIFETDSADSDKLEEDIQKSLQKTTGKNLAVRVRTLAELAAIAKLDQFKNQNREDASFLVTFLPRKTTTTILPLPIMIPKSTAEVIAAKGNEVYSVSHGHGDGALPNPYVQSKLKVTATTRNMNIIKEILEKFREENP